MSRRLIVVATTAVLFGVLPCLTRAASAQDASLERANAPMLFATPNVPLADTPAADAPQIPFNILHGSPAAHASRSMLPFYATTALMQVLDVHSTLSAMRAGAVEGNPVMSGLTAHKPAFVAVKAAIAATTIMAMKTMAKRNKFAAIATMIGINSAYAFVVSHNYQLAHSLQ